MTPATAGMANPPTATYPLLAGDDRAALAELAFGTFAGVEARASAWEPGRHLAFLPSDSLQLDLSDPLQREFGDYELLELIGEGGMGVVYRARQVSLDREVAIKLLAAGPWASRDFIERFRREAQNAARMQHPNIVAIYEIGTSETLHFFSMRLIRGSSLAQMIRRGPLTAQRAAQLLRTIAEAVDYAHRLNVLHLDLKPGNVLLDEDGTPHVADFGLARRLDRTIAAEADEISGTPSYMAPEQAQTSTHKLAAATDIWGLGAILHELVTGQPPFSADTAQATLKLVVKGEVQPPRRFAPHLPLDLQAVILKCLSREPFARYATARALSDDLTRFIEGRPVRARALNAAQRAGRWARREPRLAATTLLALLALLAGLLATTQQWRRAQRSATLASTNATLANDRLWQARIEQAATALRDGHSYQALLPLATNIMEREVQGLDAREDRIRIATAERSAPRLIDVMQMTDGITGILLSADGASVAVATDGEKLKMLDIATGTQRWEAKVTGSTHYFPEQYQKPIWLSMLRFSADGRYIVARHRQGVVDFPLPTGIDEILIDASNGKVMLPPTTAAPAFVYATYSADGSRALVHTSDHHARLMDTSDWRALGVSRPFDNVCVVANGGRFVASTDIPFTVLKLHDPYSLEVKHRYAYAATQRITSWSASPDGESLAVGHLDGHVELIDFRTGRLRDVRPSPIGRIGWIAYSADGRWFGAVADSGDVLVWDSATGQPVAPPMRLNTQPQVYHHDQLLLDPATRTVLASSDTEMALWHLPSRHTPPVRLSGEFPNIAAFWLRVFAYDAQRGLIATDGGAGQLRLWRMPALASTAWQASPLPAPQLRAGDDRVVAVDHNRVNVVDLASRESQGPAIDLPQMPTFADLTADGADVIAVSGRTLSVYEAASGSLRRAPITLANTPARVVPSPDSLHAFVLYADYFEGRNREVGQTWDLVRGEATSPSLAVEPEAGVRFSADGKSLLRWQAGELQAFDAFTLHPLWPPASPRAKLAAEQVHASPSGEEIAINDANFSKDGAEVLALTTSSSSGANLLWRFDAATGAETDHVALSEYVSGESFARTRDGRVIVQRPDDGPLAWDREHGARDLPSLGYAEYGALALSPDDTMFARAAADAIVLTSMQTLRWLSPAMPVSLPLVSDTRSDHPAQLVISTRGNSIIGRSRRGVWLEWNIAPDLRPSDELMREAVFLNPGPSPASGASRPPLNTSERLALRAEDSGAPRLRIERPGDNAIPARASDAPVNTVDLGPFFSDSIRGERAEAVDSEFPEFAPGLQRFLGVDYDVRGQVQLQTGAHPTSLSPRRVEGIRPGIARFNALDVLISGAGGLRRREPTPLAFVEITYRDGGRARLPIVYLKDVDYVGSDEPAKVGADSARIAWRATMAGTPNVYRTMQKIFAVHLANPQPQREVVSLALEAGDEDWSLPVFFAITLESPH